MMDEQDLKQTDPRRNELEQDRIVLEFAVNQLRNYLLETGETPETSFNKGSEQKTKLKRNIYYYKGFQTKLLQKIIGKYENAFMALIKEDSL